MFLSVFYSSAINGALFGCYFAVFVFFTTGYIDILQVFCNLSVKTGIPQMSSEEMYYSILSLVI